MLWDAIRKSWKLALWMIGLGLLLTFFMVSKDHWFGPVFWKVSSFTFFLWFFLWMGNAYTSDWVTLKISWTEEPLKRFFVGMLVMIVYTMGTVYVLIFLFRWTIDLKVGDTMGMIYGSLACSFLISLFMHSRGFLLSWREASLDAEKAKKESVLAQYENLKSQVNPHFLFNSLNALTNLVYQDQDQAAKFIKQLSEVYRYVLDSRDKELVTLDEELRFLNSYLYLQQIRFGDKLRVELNLSGTNGKVAPLALQMLVENAIKHNIVSEDDPLTIRLFTRADKIIVENTLQKKKILQEESAGLGLNNIKKRYEFLSNEGVVVSEGEGFFRVELPIIKGL